MQLTHHPAIFLSSAWSPDGRFIAFMRQADPDATGIYLISVLGGSERKLAEITPFGGLETMCLSWSPDGKWLAFAKAISPATQADSSRSTLAFTCSTWKPPKSGFCLILPLIACIRGDPLSPQTASISQRRVCSSAGVSLRSTCKLPMGSMRAKWRVQRPLRVLRVLPGQRTASLSSTARTCISGAFRSPAENRRSFSLPRM